MPETDEKRLDMNQVRLQRDALTGHLRSDYLDSVPLPLIVLNSRRQIVFSNKTFRRILGLREEHECLGQRPGEVLRCIYADKGDDDGCGSSVFCEECGALKTIRESIKARTEAEGECQLLLEGEAGVEARDLMVHAAPWETDDGVYYLVSIDDIGDLKRRQALERIFFHDILNTAGGARGLAEFLLEEVSGQARETVEVLRSSLFDLVEEIKRHKDLLDLELGEYKPTPMTLQGLEVITSLAAQYKAHSLALGKRIEVDGGSGNEPVTADPTLLRRVLSNMLVNALEATGPGGVVTLGLNRENDNIIFWVHNDELIPDSTRLQIFKRSFSTKGKGRGLGTYSIKMLTENHLGGTTGFSSTALEGTTFWIRLPAAG